MNDLKMLAKQIIDMIQIEAGVQKSLLGPVSEPQIQHTERKLGTRFPPSHRAFLSLYGGGDVYGFKILGIQDEQGCPPELIRANGTPRKNVSRQYVMIASAGRSRPYYLDVSCPMASGECPVVVFGSDNERIVVADSFLEFLRLIVECENDQASGSEPVYHCGECELPRREEQHVVAPSYFKGTKVLRWLERAISENTHPIPAAKAMSSMRGFANGIEKSQPPRQQARQSPPCSEG